MINGIISALQLVLILISAALILYAIMIRGDANRSTYITLLLDMCLLWMVLI